MSLLLILKRKEGKYYYPLFAHERTETQTVKGLLTAPAVVSHTAKTKYNQAQCSVSYTMRSPGSPPSLLMTMRTQSKDLKIIWLRLLDIGQAGN